MSRHVKDYITNRNNLINNSKEVHFMTNNHPYEKNVNKVNYRYSGPYVSGYKELPNVYDGYYTDINKLQLVENTLYISGVIVCSTLIIVGVMLASNK